MNWHYLFYDDFHIILELKKNVWNVLTWPTVHMQSNLLNSVMMLEVQYIPNHTKK